MKVALTQSMNWLHSWSGLLFGWPLFAIFLTGTLTVFDNEITSWMQPDLQEVSSPAGDLDGAPHHVAGLVGQTDRWGAEVPMTRPAVLMVKWQNNRTFSGQTIDPRTGNLVIMRDTQGGDFFTTFTMGCCSVCPVRGSSGPPGSPCSSRCAPAC